MEPSPRWREQPNAAAGRVYALEAPPALAGSDSAELAHLTTFDVPNLLSGAAAAFADRALKGHIPMGVYVSVHPTHAVESDSVVVFDAVLGAVGIAIPIQSRQAEMAHILKSAGRDEGRQHVYV